MIFSHLKATNLILEVALIDLKIRRPLAVRDCSNILNDPPHKVSSKTDKFWMYYSQIIFGCHVFPLNDTPIFYLYLT
jgi:hypothetical protein